MRRRSLEGRVFLFAALLSIAGLLLFFLGAMLHRHLLISTPVAVMMLLAEGGLVALAALALAVATFRALRHGSGLGLPFLAALLSLLAAASPVAVAAFAAATTPMLADLATDPDNPPAFQALSKRPDMFANDLGRFGGDAARQRAAYPALAPRHYKAAPEAVLAAAERVLVGLPAEDMARRDEAGGVLVEFTWRPGLFRFANDFVLRLTPEGAGTRVDLRAASRYGRHDLGANARLIEDILTRLDGQFP